MSSLVAWGIAAAVLLVALLVALRWGKQTEGSTNANHIIEAEKTNPRSQGL
ncbi:MAG: hypothetical protein WC184_07595 [Acidimicrobiia bacterium]